MIQGESRIKHSSPRRCSKNVMLHLRLGSRRQQKVALQLSLSRTSSFIIMSKERGSDGEARNVDAIEEELSNEVLYGSLFTRMSSLNREAIDATWRSLKGKEEELTLLRTQRALSYVSITHYYAARIWCIF